MSRRKKDVLGGSWLMGDGCVTVTNYTDFEGEGEGERERERERESRRVYLYVNRRKSRWQWAVGSSYGKAPHTSIWWLLWLQKPHLW